jgi:hypothetical protein
VEFTKTAGLDTVERTTDVFVEVTDEEILPVQLPTEELTP